MECKICQKCGKIMSGISFAALSIWVSFCASCGTSEIPDVPSRGEPQVFYFRGVGIGITDSAETPTTIRHNLAFDT